MTKKNKKAKSAARKASAASKSDFKEVPRTRRRSLAIAAAIIAIVILAVWGIKSFADGSDAAKEAPQQTSTPSTSQDASSKSSASSSGKDGIWSLSATSIDMDEVTALGVPAIIDFGSDECIPCKQMAPVLRDTNAAMQGKALIKFVDVWEYPNAADGFPIQVIPTQVLINADGTPFAPSSELERKYNLQFSSYSDKSGKLAFTTHQGAISQEQMDAILEEMGV